MDIATVLSAAQVLFAALKCKELKDIWSICGYKSHLDDLQGTVDAVKKLLHDAETMQELDEQTRLYIQELRSAVYDADDLFDKFVTLAQQQRLIKGGKATKQLSNFFSNQNPLVVAPNMSQQVKKVRKSLDGIAKNHAQFDFKIDRQRMEPRKETFSPVDEGEIVGREEDVEKIVGHLLNDSNNRSQKDVSFLTIVGVGGLGKTALARLVYNDARVKSAFRLRMWTCVLDHDKEFLDEAQILRKIFTSANSGQSYETSDMDWLQSQLREQLRGNRYLLVLDDVWTENRYHWRRLVEFLLVARSGSWIIVTTRSHETAGIIGDSSSIKYELQGLSKENAWSLFKKNAFGSDMSSPHKSLVKIGEEIIKSCVGVPLAIRVSGSLLYGKDVRKWQLFQKNGVSNSEKSEKDIMNILMFSYHQLEPPLKSCFTYCALFPKDFVLKKELLISCWMAQGYIVPCDNQTVEDAAEEYFSTLFQRCFFHEVKFEKESGKIISFKIHDLMHDIAIKVAGMEICRTNFPSTDMDEKVRHLAYTSADFEKHCFTKTHIRSYHYVGTLVSNPRMDRPYLDALFTKWTCLRALDFCNVIITRLPESIGGLLHLRYLNLLNNRELDVLPKSITKLWNLQTLKIGGCPNLKELPQDFTKLVNLRTLEITECGIECVTCLGAFPYLKTIRLTSLVELEYIISATANVNGVLSCPSLEKLMLWELRKLKGCRDSRVLRKEDIKTTRLWLPQLKSLEISMCEEMEGILVCPSLEHMGLGEFKESMQVNKVVSQETYKWVTEQEAGSSNHNYLTSVITSNIRWLNKMPKESFQFLQKLHINGDGMVKSLGEANEVFSSCASSLEFLSIRACYRLKKVMSGGLEHLTALKTLRIQSCRYLSLLEEGEEHEQGITQPSFCHTLRHLKLDSFVPLRELPNWMQALTALETLEIKSGEAMEAIPDWITKLTSLRELRINGHSVTLKERPHIRHLSSIHILLLFLLVFFLFFLFPYISILYK